MNLTRQGTGLGRATVILLAVATGLSVAGVYYAQPLLDEIRIDLHLPPGTAGLIVTVTQLGFAAGLLLLVPLGDLVERRRLITVMCVLSAAGLVMTGLATGPTLLFTASLVVGTFSTAAQLLAAYAATSTAEGERGRVVGTIMSGLLIGVLLARTVSGYLAVYGGWRMVYWVAAALMLLLAFTLLIRLPKSPPTADLRYAALLRSVFALLREEPLLRLRSLYGVLGMADFSVLWTSLGLMLAEPPYRYSPALIGLFGLAGAAGAVAASLAGRVADRGGAGLTTGVCGLLMTAAWLPMSLGQHSLALLIVGIVVFDLAAQALHITNQSQIYTLRPEARSRLTSAYMTCYFIGGVAGSGMSSIVYTRAGWTGVSVLGAVLGVATLLVRLCTPRRGCRR
ncbi:MFS transporter [Streptomyces sp. NPDC056161]|uniref:MFS transporter n=1 Tax=Streptomyces sp. NPDC056161 TaxID=3345732 RepID=UPI0035D96EC0